MVCDEGGRSAMIRRQGLWRNQHGKAKAKVVQSRVVCALSVRAGDARSDSDEASVPIVRIGSAEGDCERCVEGWKVRRAQ